MLSAHGLKGLQFDVVPSTFDESTIKPADFPDPAAFVTHSALCKAREVAERCPGAELIIGADTVIVNRNTVLGKPKTERQAHEWLLGYSETEHAVITGVCLLRPGHGAEVSFSTSTTVKFRKLDERLVSSYVATGEPMDKAGGYGIQGQGAVLVAGIEGDYNNVVGLPLHDLSAHLEVMYKDLDNAQAPSAF